MPLNRKRERLDNPIITFNNKFFTVGKDSSNNILTLKFSSDEIRRSINLNSPMRVNLSDKGNLSLCNREVKTAVGIHVDLEFKSLWQVLKRFPETISEFAREPCSMFFLGKAPVRFLVMIIVQESLTGSPKDNKGRTGMPSQNPLLPKSIKTLNRGISSWFSLRDECQVDSQKQMKTNNLREAVRVASSTCRSHLIVHLRDGGNPHNLPCINKMRTQRDCLFIWELTCPYRMACHIHCVKGIKPDNSFWTSEMSGAHEVCLMQISHFLCLRGWIRLVAAITISFSPGFPSFPMSRENPGNGRDSGNIMNLSLFKFPMNSLSSNSREGGTTRPMRFQFFSDSQNLSDQTIRTLPPNSLWDSTSVFESLEPFFLISLYPFGEPESSSLNQMENPVKADSFFIKLYCLAASFMLTVLIHRLFLPPIVSGRTLGDINPVCDVMIFF